MKSMLNAGAVFASCLLVVSAAFAAGSDDDDDAPPGKNGELPTLTAEQQKAAGIVTAHPVNAKVAQRDDATGQVLDPVALVTDAGEADAAAAAAHAASAELERVRGLFAAGAGASQKTLQAAQADEARTRAQSAAAAAKFTAHWGPLAALAGGARQKLVDDVAAGKALLLRADLPGRHLIGSAPDRALLDVDGIGVPGKVLGVLAHTVEEAQSVGVLVEVRNAPAGLGAGARVPVALLGAEHAGLLIAREAVLYDDNGALVYKQLTAKAGPSRPSMASGGGQQVRYAPVRIKLLQAQGDAWLVDGIDDDDDIVVHGAGVLWSLQGIVGHAAGDIDDDD